LITKIRKNEPAKYEGILLTEADFRYLSQQDAVSEHLQEKINRLTMENIRCVDRAPVIDDITSGFYGFLIGAGLTVLAISVYRPH